MANVYGYFDDNTAHNNKNYVTLDTEQSITAAKNFTDINLTDLSITTFPTYTPNDLPSEVYQTQNNLRFVNPNNGGQLQFYANTGSQQKLALLVYANGVTCQGNTVFSTSDFSGTGSVVNNCAMPIASDSTTIVPTTAWVQSAITAKIPTATNTFYYNTNTVDGVSTFTVTPASAYRSCYFIIAAGGGGGASTDASGNVKFGGGGGAGACGQSKIYSWDDTASKNNISFQITVGGGASGGNVTIANDPGKNGKNSSVVAYYGANVFDTNTANGGQGGYSANGGTVTIGGAGGTCTAGTWCFTQSGETGFGNGSSVSNPSAVNKATFSYSLGGRGGQLYGDSLSMIGAPGFVKMVCGF